MIAFVFFRVCSLSLTRGISYFFLYFSPKTRKNKTAALAARDAWGGDGVLNLNARFLASREHASRPARQMGRVLFLDRFGSAGRVVSSTHSVRRATLQHRSYAARSNARRSSIVGSFCRPPVDHRPLDRHRDRHRDDQRTRRPTLQHTAVVAAVAVDIVATTGRRRAAGRVGPPGTEPFAIPRSDDDDDHDDHGPAATAVHNSVAVVATTITVQQR